MSDAIRRFDFGPAEPSPGYIKVRPGCAYDPRTGYGFIAPDRVAFRDRGEPDAPKRDFGIPVDATFRLDVPNDSYIVSLLMGDWIAPVCTTLKTGAGRLAFRHRHVPAGQFARETFAVRVEDEGLRLTFSGPAPRANVLEIEPAPDLITLHLAGDSTVADQPAEGFPYAGWGQVLSSFFKHDVAVANHARSGRSAKSFVEEGRLDAILREIRPDGYLFVQFGHNDQKPDEARHTEAESTYRDYLKRYLDGTRARGAHPVLLTSVHRRYFAGDGTLRDTHGPYLEAVRELAAREEVPLIDLADMSRSLFEKLGPEETKDVFMWSAPGEFLHFPEGIQDNKHFQERGALALAELVVGRVRELVLWPLAMYLKS
ncbi:rhamnogalacturonan acetylesterase [Cohnella sp. REN36]|uniref:rhamnogalacturonan acetylesterase n=1 Tax=Cohnella sp. REN36 TaxID=2887347 RepID=UPI001D13379C|nr:GDSL-type esterase/lipase family protein [Cohnella sp. REN36]MCC3377576.1 GDSL-type esterase/lipase family protein [Cohnella sp. REN36]